MKTLIILPFYNKIKQFVIPCLNSLKEATGTNADILLINDGSIESVPLDMFKGVNYEYHPNIGYLKTVNKAYSDHPDYDNYVFLNSDTLVTEGWLDKMLNVLSKNIGIVCPVSNSASQLTVHYNNKYTPNQWNKYVEQYSENRIIDTVTPVGFCMLITRQCILSVCGATSRHVPFDPIFNMGYGEECDFGEKARQLGYKQVCCTNTFIYHEHHGSFVQVHNVDALKKESKRIYHSRWSSVFKANQSKWDHEKPLEYLNNRLKSI